MQQQAFATLAVCFTATALLECRRSRRAWLLPVHVHPEPARLLRPLCRVSALGGAREQTLRPLGYQLRRWSAAGDAYCSSTTAAAHGSRLAWVPSLCVIAVPSPPPPPAQLTRHSRRSRLQPSRRPTWRSPLGQSSLKALRVLEAITGMTSPAKALRCRCFGWEAMWQWRRQLPVVSKRGGVGAFSSCVASPTARLDGMCQRLIPLSFTMLCRRK